MWIKWSNLYACYNTHDLFLMFVLVNLEYIKQNKDDILRIIQQFIAAVVLGIIQ